MMRTAPKSHGLELQDSPSDSPVVSEARAQSAPLGLPASAAPLARGTPPWSLRPWSYEASSETKGFWQFV